MYMMFYANGLRHWNWSDFVYWHDVPWDKSRDKTEYLVRYYAQSAGRN